MAKEKERLPFATGKFIKPVLEYEVIDGDTVRVVLDLGFNIRFSTHIRVYLVDTPEKRVAEQHDAAMAVKQAVEQWFEAIPPDQLMCESVCADKYGERWVGDFFRLRQSVPTLAEFLIDNKYAHYYDGTAKTPWTETELKMVAAKATKDISAAY
jgi:endonuclease YncB( thermonuclease family)